VERVVHVIDVIDVIELSSVPSPAAPFAVADMSATWKPSSHGTMTLTAPH